MRKDYIEVSERTSAMDETSFVADYWTKVWQGVGGPTAAIERVKRKEEFRIMMPYVATLAPGSRLLDGGCGLGEWTAYFSKLGYPTRGLDLSADTVANLKRIFPDGDYAVGDIRKIDMAEGAVDGYFSWGTFEHFEDGLDGCLGEAHRVLKPGGLLFVSVPFDNLRHSVAACFGAQRRQAVRARGLRFYQWRLTRGELRLYLENNGFEVLALRPISKRQGVMRFLHHNLGLHHDWRFTKLAAAAIAPFVWSGFIAHMLMAVARKRP